MSSEFIAGASVRSLLKMHADILEALRERKVVRTANNPSGDYAEALFAKAYGWTLANNSASGHDATSAAGVRYQIKGRRITARNRSRQLSAIRRLPDQTFDFLAGVLFNSDYSVLRGILIPHSVVVTCARRVEHTNSWKLILDDKCWSMPGAIDATPALIAAAAEI